MTSSNECGNRNIKEHHSRIGEVRGNSPETAQVDRPQMHTIFTIHSQQTAIVSVLLEVLTGISDRNVRQNRTVPRMIAFGDFELRLDTRELTKNDECVRLAPQPFHILRKLLEEPGAVITREELRSALWPPNTHVDFEAGLNTAVNRLRTILGDSADAPVYIETVSRSGYRFIAAVRSFATVVSIPFNSPDSHVTATQLAFVRPSDPVKVGTLDRLRTALRSAVRLVVRR
jgi:DNA-binding winged helix-turn-helix (wHTH) protein